MYLRRKWQEDAAQLHDSFQFEKSILRTQKTLLRRRNFVIDWMEPPTFSCTSLGILQSPLPYDTIKKLSHQHFFPGFKHNARHRFVLYLTLVRKIPQELSRYHRVTMKFGWWSYTRDSRILNAFCCVVARLTIRYDCPYMWQEGGTVRDAYQSQLNPLIYHLNY